MGTLTMPGNPREIVTMAERRFPVRIRIGVPPSGFGQRYTEITEWLDGNCGADGWAITPSGTRGVLNDAVSIYFRDATLASAFVVRWCVASKVETEGGLFRIRDDELAPRIGTRLHRTPQKSPPSIIGSNGLLSNPTPAVQPDRGERVFMPQSGHCAS
jgi:hypothetical protein